MVTGNQLTPFGQPQFGDTDMCFNLDKLPSRRDSLVALSARVPQFHRGAKCIPEDLVTKALDNEPFEDHSRVVYAVQRPGQDAGEETTTQVQDLYRRWASNFLHATFSSLSSIDGISFDIVDFDKAAEVEPLSAASKRYADASLPGQVQSLAEAYSGMCVLREILGSVNEQGAYGMETILPARYLPEVLVATPVWFVCSKNRPKKRPAPRNNQEVTYFCDLVGSTEFAWLYQMYNRLPRRMEEFEGRDVMPMSIVDIVAKTRNIFDFLVITTPYHDLATKEWRTGWQRNVDPFLFGFLRQLPQYMFFLGRWSGTGLFPMIGDLIADTMEHVRANQRLLVNFEQYTPWYRGGSGDMLGVGRNGNHPLAEFARTLLGAYESKKLFPFLRGKPLSV